MTCSRCGCDAWLLFASAEKHWVCWTCRAELRKARREHSGFLLEVLFWAVIILFLLWLSGLLLPHWPTGFEAGPE